MDLTTNEARLGFAGKWAAKYGIDRFLLCAVIEQESTWEPGAVRYEPAFYRHYIQSMNLPILEGYDRATSWGLMQIMGQTAVEFGFRGDLTALRDPDTGVDYGCRKLQKCFALHGEAQGALLAYNGGADSYYPGQVLARVGHYSTSPSGTAEGAD